MNFKHIWIVFKKEMIDAFRDKKSVLTNIFLPLILIPLMYYAMSFFMNSSTKEVEQNMKISINANKEDISKAIEFTKNNILADEIAKNKIEIKEYENNDKMKEALMSGEINCIINYDAGFFGNIDKGEASGITLSYNSTKNSSQLAAQILNTKLMNLNQMFAVQKLNELNISPGILNLVTINEVDASLESNSGGKAANQMLMMIIPMYLVIVIVTAGTPIAIDILAGERERNTFESLLSTKANRLSILMGKYLSILVFSIIAIIMSFIGLILGIVMNPEMFSTGGQAMGITEIFAAMNMPIGALLFVLLSSITLATVFAGLQIAISTWARNVKEAQTYLSYMMFPSMIIAFATMFMGAGDMEFFMSFIPIFNTVASLKMVLGGIVDYGFLVTGVLVNLVFVVLVTGFIIRLFNNEKIVIK